MENYVSEMKILLKQTQMLEEKMMELHQTQLKGQSPATTENNFLRKACSLDTYGVDPHPVKVGIEHLQLLQGLHILSWKTFTPVITVLFQRFSNLLFLEFLNVLLRLTI